MPTPKPCVRRKVRGSPRSADSGETQWHSKDQIYNDWGADYAHIGVLTEIHMKRLGWVWKERDENLLWPAWPDGTYVEYSA